ncbi:hypothetical protein [Burkholderia ubonensis]|uniref:hypothetical protein n=1 Tax=Burkholderia ubonensis TaxID=101571 RepID=UPI000AC452DE|nr:hypothetical protein [Burkholderia ubonensis]
MTTDKSRADALTDEQIEQIARNHELDMPDGQDSIPALKAAIYEALDAASPVEQPAAALIGAVRAYGVFRTRPDENDGKEFFYHANWHNDYIAPEGERIVEGWFVPAAAPVYDAEEMRDAAMRTVQAMGLIYTPGSDRWRPNANHAPSPSDERAAWDNTRHSLAVAMCGFATRSGSRDLDAAISVLDAITEAGSPLSWLRTARAASSPKPAVEQPAATPSAYRDVFNEIDRAIRKFPTWPTDPLHAVAVLGEEFGELTKAMLQHTYEPHKSTRDDVRTEAIQTAAMALRLIASLDRYEFRHCEQHEQAN